MQRGDFTKLNFEGLEMQKLNIPTDRAWRADEKNGINLVIMVISRVMIIKMSRMDIFCIWEKNLSAPERHFLFLSENSLLVAFVVNV